MTLRYRSNGGYASRQAETAELGEQFDVIVVGLGTAGSVAAIAAARRGLRVIGLERLCCMGGQSTAGGVMCYYFGSLGGLYEKLDKEAFRLEEAGFIPTHGDNHVGPEAKKHALERAAVSAGVCVVYDAVAVGVYLEDNRVAGVRWLADGEFKSALAHVVIDATADGDICAMSGCEFELGRESDGVCLPYSNAAFVLSEGKLTWHNADAGYTDPTDGAALSRDIAFSSSQPFHLREDYLLGERLLAMSGHPGVREGRRIVGETILTFADFADGRLPGEPLLYAYANLDNHGKDLAFESELHQEWTVVCNLFRIYFSLPVPAGAIIPKGVRGLLAAGRHLSCDHDIACMLRMKRDMHKLGEAAAILACASVSAGTAPDEVPYADIAGPLRSSGCLDKKNDCGIKEMWHYIDEKNEAATWMTDPGEIGKALASEKPNIALWSCRRLGKLPQLAEWIRSPERNLARHSALAMGLLRDGRCLPLLREMARERDGFVPSPARKHYHSRGCGAVFLLGALRDRGSAAMLVDMLLEGPERYAGESCEHVESPRDIWFQYFTQALMALLRIGDAHECLRGMITASVRGALTGRSLTLDLLRGGRPGYDFAPRVRAAADSYFRRWDV